MLRLYFFIVIFCHCTTTIDAQGWVQKHGEGFFKVGQSGLSTNKIFNYDGSEFIINNNGIFVTSLYGEYGITKHITGILYFPFLYNASFGELTLQPSGQQLNADREISIGDAEASMKLAIIQSTPVVLSGILTLGFPTGTTDGGVSGLLQTGDGEFNQLIELAAGMSLYPKPFWVSGSVGINNRTKGFSDEFRYKYEFGLNHKDNLMAILKVNGAMSFMNGFENDLLASNFSNDVEYLVAQFELSKKVYKTFWGSLNLSYPFWGRKYLKTPVYMVSIFYLLKK